jgi:RNA polymerase sigma-B factor
MSTTTAPTQTAVPDARRGRTTAALEPRRQPGLHSVSRDRLAGLGRNDPGAADRLAALFDEYQRTGDRRIRNELVEAHRHVADYYVKRYTRRGVGTDDLSQVALLAIVRAVDRFDPAQGVEFSTFASRTIDGELKRYFRDRTWTVRPPRSAQERHLALRHAQEVLIQRLHRSPTIPELAAEVGESVDHVLEALEAGGAHQTNSLDQTTAAGSEAEGSTLADRVLGHEDRGFADAEDRHIVHDLLETLGEREQLIIRMRFFENRTQEDIAAEIGVSQSYLSRILRKALVELRTKLGDGADVLLAAGSAG